MQCFAAGCPNTDVRACTTCMFTYCNTCITSHPEPDQEGPQGGSEGGVPPPGPIQFSSVSTNSVTISWSPPEVAPGSDGYRVSWRRGQEQHWRVVADCEMEVPGLLPAEEYHFTVSTLSEDDHESTCVEASVYTEVPMPENLTVDPSCNALKWTKPEGVDEVAYLVGFISNGAGGEVKNLYTRDTYYDISDFQDSSEYTVQVATLKNDHQSKPTTTRVPKEREQNSCEIPPNIKLQLKFTNNHKVRMEWSGLLKDDLDKDPYIDVFNKSDPSTPLFTHLLNYEESGFKDTSIPLKDGLHMRLVGTERSRVDLSSSTPSQSNCEPEDNQLSLLSRKGNLWARLKLKKSLTTDWKKTQEASWVGFYSKDSQKHIKRQWLSKFPKLDTDNHMVYEHDSSITMCTGVYARFCLEKANLNLSGRTKTLVKRVLFTTPEFDEANGAPRMPLQDFHASLQLFKWNQCASVRLYIYNSFPDWKQTFRNAWVGVYRRPSVENSDCKWADWKRVRNFVRNLSPETSEYMVYEHNFSVMIEAGFQARFFLGDDYSTINASTVPWKGIVP